MADNDFTFNYDGKKAKEIKKIVEKYTVVLSDSYEEIKKLDREAERPAKLWFAILLIAGILIFGGGLSLVLVSESYFAGSVVGFSGIIIFIYSFHLKKQLLEKRRKEYGPRILALLKKEQ